MRNTTVTLGDTNYSVPHLNLGEIEEIDEVFRTYDSPTLKRSTALLAIVMRRAQPKIEDVRVLEIAPPEMAEAINEVLRFSGLVEQKDPNAPAPGEPAQASGETSTDVSKLTAD